MPPTSKYFDSSSSESSPSVSFSSTASTSDSGFSSRTRTKPHRQSTSEAAIVSIYSMYTDDQPTRASWVQDDTKDIPQIKLDCRQSYLSESDNRDSTELAYFQEDTPIIDLTDPGNTSIRLSNHDSPNSSCEFN